MAALAFRLANALLGDRSRAATRAPWLPAKLLLPAKVARDSNFWIVQRPSSFAVASLSKKSLHVLLILLTVLVDDIVIENYSPVPFRLHVLIGEPLKLWCRSFQTIGGADGLRLLSGVWSACYLDGSPPAASFPFHLPIQRENSRLSIGNSLHCLCVQLLDDAFLHAADQLGHLLPVCKNALLSLLFIRHGVGVGTVAVAIPFVLLRCQWLQVP
mmetsp:Transcript_11913/g.22318  ORF Transcript_11913/g.22318 Transcript_11913/m.22318 type:complete len:214 (-) Transcript_11913:684-1325(-)